MRWQLNPQYDPVWRCWGTEEYILFNTGSAQTHQLNQFAADILAVLKAQPLDVSDISSRLAELYEDLGFDNEIAAYLQETLILLDDLGLIEPELP